MGLESRLHEPPLDPATTAVHEPHLGQAGVSSRVQIFLDHRHDVARLEAMEIEFRRNGQPHRVVVEGILHDDRVGYAFA